MTPAELRERIAEASANILLLDVREPWEFEKCHIEGSRLVPMAEVAAASEDIDPDQEIIVICHHGMRSEQIGLFLEQTGFSNVANLEGGLDAWAREVDPSMPTY